MSSFHPERKAVKRLINAEKDILYHMLKDERAIEFYENKIESFYDSIYRKIADYIIEYYQSTQSIDLIGLIASIESKELSDGDELINEIASISSEENHISEIDESYLEDILNTINKEKEKLHLKNMLERMLVDKDPLEKARILNDHMKRIKNRG